MNGSAALEKNNMRVRNSPLSPMHRVLLLATVASVSTAPVPDFPALPVYQRALVVLGMSSQEATKAAEDYDAVRKCNDELLDAMRGRGVNFADLAGTHPTAALAAADAVQDVLRAHVNVTLAGARECLLRRGPCGTAMQEACGTRYSFEFREGSLGRLWQRVLYAMFLPSRNRALSLLGDTTVAQQTSQPMGQLPNPFSIFPTSSGGENSAFFDLIRASTQAFTQMSSAAMTPGKTGFPIAPRRKLDGFGVQAFPSALSLGTKSVAIPGEDDEKMARAFADSVPELTETQRADLVQVLLHLDMAARKLGMDIFTELPPYMQQSLLLSAMAPDKSSLNDAIARVDFLQRTELLANLAKSVGLTHAERAALVEYAAGDSSREHTVFAVVLDRHFPVSLNSSEREALVAFFRAQPRYLRAVSVAYDWLAGHAER